MFKKKPVVIDCYTYDRAAHTFFKPDKGIKFLPQWWKDLPNDTPDNFKNMKGCAGLIDYYKNGIVIPAWSYFNIGIRNKEVSWFARNGQVDFHAPAQRGDFASNFVQCKLLSPWAFSCSEEINFLWNIPLWSFTDPEKIINLQGILNFKYQNATNVNLLFKDSEDGYEFPIKEGTPLAILHPITEREVVLKYHYVDKQKWEEISVVRYPSRRFDYLNAKKALKSLESKCPFGFGGK